MLVDDADFKANQIVDHYRIISLLGEGGMGTAYLAEDTKLHRRVALKFLSRKFTQDEERLRRFELEARAASVLNHPARLKAICHRSREDVRPVTRGVSA